MYTVFLAGGIGSGKSTVASELENLGARRIDLDQLSRDVLAPGSAVTMQVAQAFGSDLLDPESGAINRGLLAQRAFATNEKTQLLEDIEIPAIAKLLQERLDQLASADDAPELCVVEVPLLDRMGDNLDIADEIVVVSCPLALRRVRAVQRGMTVEDFDARAAKQPSDEWLLAHATSAIPNEGSAEELYEHVRDWYDRRFVGEEE